MLYRMNKIIQGNSVIECQRIPLQGNQCSMLVQTSTMIDSCLNTMFRNVGGS